jgi:drug/metabolite transporter (DMT)-like permease
MSFDDVTRVWRDQPPASPAVMASLLTEVRRNQRDFAATILRRDLVEIVVGLGLAGAFVAMWWRQGLPSFLVCASGAAFVAGFLLVDRWRREKPRPESSLREHVEQSLVDVEHQLGLLRNVLWWYILPLEVGLVLHVFDLWRQPDLQSPAGRLLAVLMGALCLATGWFVYLLNQSTVRTTLQPRHEELRRLRESLTPADGEAAEGIP